MEELALLIQRAFDSNTEGITVEEMKLQGYRLITAPEYLEALKENERRHKTKLISLWKPIKLQPKVSNDKTTIDTFASLVDSKGMLAHSTIETCVIYDNLHDDDATVYSTAETVRWPGAPYKKNKSMTDRESKMDSDDNQDSRRASSDNEDEGNNEGKGDDEDEEDELERRGASYIANDGICTANDSLTLWGDLKFD